MSLFKEKENSKLNEKYSANIRKNHIFNF